jgi:hypothetical protein
MDLDRVLRDLSNALATGNGARDRVRNGRRVVARACLAELGIEPPPKPMLPDVVRLAVASPNRAARRDCATLLLHTLAVPGLVPAEAHRDVCALAEDVLRTALLRTSYPFGGSTEAKVGVLERLHTRIAELTEPLQPTFPNWQGLYAG